MHLNFTSVRNTLHIYKHCNRIIHDSMDLFCKQSGCITPLQLLCYGSAMAHANFSKTRYVLVEGGRFNAERSQFFLTQSKLKVKSYHLLRSVRITWFLATEIFSGNSCVFWCVLKLQSLVVSIFELHGFESSYGYMSQMQSAES